MVKAHYLDIRVMKIPEGKAAAKYAARANRARHYVGEKYRIEGDYVGTQDIGKRLGVSTRNALDRLRREQGKDGPVTWAGLASD